MKPAIPEHGLILLDGAQYEDAIEWLNLQYPTACPRALLQNTPYEPIAAAGPLLLIASRGDPAYTAWWEGSDLQNGVWLTSGKSMTTLLPILQRRLRIRDEQARELWLRLGHGPALRNAWLSGAPWPPGFWYGIDSVWLRHDEGAICAWQNTTPEADAAPGKKGLTAQITLCEPLLHALNLPASLEHTR